jgi:hypothetical protein
LGFADVGGYDGLVAVFLAEGKGQFGTDLPTGAEDEDGGVHTLNVISVNFGKVKDNLSLHE